MKDTRVPESQAKYIRQIESILKRALTGRTCEVYLFGSRATGDHSRVSDFDIAVLTTDDLSRELSLAREWLEESTIPFKVDVVDLRSASAAVRRRALTDGVLLWKN